MIMKVSSIFIFFILSFPLFAQTKDSVGVMPTDIFMQGASAKDIQAVETMLAEPLNQTFWKAFTERFSDSFQSKIYYSKAKNTDIDAFEMELYEQQQTQTTFLKEYPKYLYLSAPFKQFVENNIRWSYWRYILAYPIVRGNAQTKFLQVTSLPSVMLEDFDESKVNDENAFLCEPYRQFLMYYITYFNSKSKSFAKYSDMAVAATDKYNYAKEHLSGKVFQYWLSRYMVESCGVTPPSKTREMYLILSKLNGAEGYAKAVKETCDEAMNRKEEVKPKEEPKKQRDKNELVLTDTNGKEFGLSDLKGKVVYLDIWASWCGPCRKEFPHSKELYNKLSDKQKKKIVFLFVSIDDTADAWKRALEQLQLPGEHGHSSGGWQARIVNYFRVQSIPRYILIDKNGEIANIEAPRPSSPELWNELLKLME
jgi:thiol-disulfide isomerase/thioredoxin